MPMFGTRYIGDGALPPSQGQHLLHQTWWSATEDTRWITKWEGAESVEEAEGLIRSALNRPWQPGRDKVILFLLSMTKERVHEGSCCPSERSSLCEGCRLQQLVAGELYKRYFTRCPISIISLPAWASYADVLGHATVDPRLFPESVRFLATWRFKENEFGGKKAKKIRRWINQRRADFVHWFMELHNLDWQGKTTSPASHSVQEVRANLKPFLLLSEYAFVRGDDTTEEMHRALTELAFEPNECQMTPSDLKEALVISPHPRAAEILLAMDARRDYAARKR